MSNSAVSLFVLLACLAIPRPLACQSAQQSELWHSIKRALTGPQGKQYFESGMKNALLPVLAGTLVASKPAAHPNEFLVAMEDDKTPEVKLKLAGRLEKPLPAGTPVSFEGIPLEFTVQPFLVTFQVNTVNRAATRSPAPPSLKKESK